MFITADLLFSYWLFVWFLIYYIMAKTVKGVGFANPLIAFVIVFIVNTFICLYLLSYNKNYLGIIVFIVLNIIIKVIPIILLIGEPIHIWNNICITLFVFLLYNLYLYYNNTDIFTIYNLTVDSIINNKNNTPILHLINTTF